MWSAMFDAIMKLGESGTLIGKDRRARDFITT
jgi:hypothetical protein